MFDTSSHALDNRGMTASVEDALLCWRVRLDSRRRPTLPEEALQAAGFSPGEELRVRVAERGLLVLETPAHALKRARSRVVGTATGKSVVDQFLAQRAVEAQGE